MIEIFESCAQQDSCKEDWYRYHDPKQNGMFSAGYASSSPRRNSTCQGIVDNHSSDEEKANVLEH
jgi:hypothetical protein